METNHAIENAQGWYESICEMVAALDCDYDRLEELRDADELDDDEKAELAELETAAGECYDADEARERIEESVLCVDVRSGWSSPGELEPEEYRILLTTGGPALQITGDLRGNYPSSARLQYQDWFTPWTEYSDVDRDVLLTFAGCFYFGE